VKPEEYAEFYKSIAHDDAEPAKVIHYTAEGANEFRVLAFVPAHKPLEMEWGEPKTGLRLYVQRVLIMDRCEEVLPMYLRFVKGVVDSSDLPLNVSREILQRNPLLDSIRKSVVKNVLDGLAAMKNTEYAKYVPFFQGLGPVLKEGLGQDWANREKIADLVLFESVKTPRGEYTTLARYVEAMPSDQKEIYYLIGEERELIEHSPYLEAFRAKGYDVLLLTDPVDEFAIPALGAYKDKKLQAADRGELDDAKDDQAPADESFKNVLAFLKGKLEDVSDVRLSKRLTDSAAVLVADKGSDDGAHGTAHAALRPRGRGGCQAGPGTEPDSPRRDDDARPVRKEPAGLARRKLRETLSRPGHHRGRVEGERPDGVREARERVVGEIRSVTDRNEKRAGVPRGTPALDFSDFSVQVTVC